MTNREHPHDGRATADAAIVAALVTGATQREAAKQARVSLTTVRRRLADPEFRRLLDAARAELVQQAADRLAGHLLATADVLLNVATDTEAPHAARVSAARAVHELAARWRSEVDIEERLAHLEARIAAGQQPQPPDPSRPPLRRVS